MMSLNSALTIWTCCVVLVLYGIGPERVHGACDVCQANGAACINATSYHLCFGSAQPSRDQTFTCTDGFVCTDRTIICMQSSQRPASCGDMSTCGRCNENLVFACTSRTTFSFCFGATQPTNVNGTCPTGRVCDASTQEICVETVQSNSIICDSSTPVVALYDESEE